MQPYKQNLLPAFSVIITSYNDGAFIEEAILSVLNSSFTDFEIIIVDDCSTDEITHEKLKALENEGYTIIRKSINLGVGDSRNKGISMAKGKYILTLDADDRILATYLEKAFIQLESGYDVVYCNVKKFGTQEIIVIPPGYSFNLLLAGNYIVNCSPFTKTIWENAGGYDTEMDGYEDWEFWVSVAEKGGKFYHINEVLFEYRIKLNSLNNKLSDPDYRSESVKYVCSKHSKSYHENAAGIIPYLHKQISLLEAENQRISESKKSFFWKLKMKINKFISK